MIYRSTVDLPLHTGKCPPWLFEKMVRLSRAIILVILQEFGKQELLKRLADPLWFQALGCLLGFDWHSSGLTTTVGGAIKKAFCSEAKDWGVFICGGKGARALSTPSEIEEYGEKAGLGEEIKNLITLSRLVARIDNNALQDGFDLYFHLFIFTKEGEWVVIQQGMDERTLYARRYHWYGPTVKNFFEDPHQGIASPIRKAEVLNLTAKESQRVRESILNLLKEPLSKILREIRTVGSFLFKREHSLSYQDISPELLPKVLEKTYQSYPKDFKDLLLTPGLGAKGLRALTLTAELIYEVKASRKDPVHYAYAHGGKDGYPYRINTQVYENTIRELEFILRQSSLPTAEKDNKLKNLLRLFR
ncbi:MAG: DUF763 domain-containing protein [Caldimicrobium sp.]|nr:DUF763 domain-containing protein [Caldimicrobium sp.]MCX7873709.1 DUF763 domain-containing protein [Caldimicrobium sp.]MDW8093633.1 DUF763 domain-containing protein [Caldimicrobium sp.]